MYSPIKVIREAVVAVPAVKYALGIGGVLATVALVYAFSINVRVAVIGTMVVLLLMGVLVIFARMAALPGAKLNMPALAFTWFVLLFFMATTSSLFSSVFFQKPVDLQYWLTGSPVVTSPPKLYAPYDNTTFRQYPRTTTLKWQPVSEATHYLVELQYSLPLGGDWYDLPSGGSVAVVGTEHTFEFPGAQPGRWRVTAVFEEERKSPPSNWWHFRHEQ